ncbi:MAG: hypothetical protein MR437_06595 [Clostridiales bacterium]|nr:hypothetical protein [Clostridiales bacterium]
MKSKKAKSLNKLISLVGALLAIVAVVMVFLPQIAAVNGDTTFNGIAIAFGKKLSSVDGGSFFKSSTTINFSFLNLLAYVLVVLGLVINVLQLVGIAKGKLMSLIAALALVAGGILFFFALKFSSVTTSGAVLGIGGEATSKFSDFNTDSAKVWQLGYGAIVGGITAILSGLCSLGRTVLSK